MIMTATHTVEPVYGFLIANCEGLQVILSERHNQTSDTEDYTLWEVSV